MRTLPVAALTLLLGLACGTAELTDGRRMPVVKVEAQVTATCARPWSDWPPHDTDDTADTGGPTGCEPEPDVWSMCGGDDDIELYEDPDANKLMVETNRETVDGWDALVWLSRRDYERVPDSAWAEDAVGVVNGEAWVRGTWVGTLYTVAADGSHDVLRDDLLVADQGDQLVFAYPIRGFDVVEVHQIGWIDERRVEPDGREGPSCCCVSGPTRASAGTFAAALALVLLRRRRS